MSLPHDPLPWRTSQTLFDIGMCAVDAANGIDVCTFWSHSRQHATGNMQFVLRATRGYYLAVEALQAVLDASDEGRALTELDIERVKDALLNLTDGGTHVGSGG